MTIFEKEVITVNREIGEKECPKCLGKGAILHGKIEVMDETCPKCKGKGTLDWIENIVGVRGTHIKPGVYTREVDVSFLIKPGEKYELGAI